MSAVLPKKNIIIDRNDLILVTGARGFIGKWVVAKLLDHGFTNIRCLMRPSLMKASRNVFPGAEREDVCVELIEGNLLSQDDCDKVARNVSIVYHLAAGRGEKSFPGAYQNSVITTRNLLEAILGRNSIKRFVNVSSFTVYSNRDKPQGRLLDEECPTEIDPIKRGSPYCFAKIRQEEVVFDYGAKYKLPYVNIRPGVVYGPGNEQIHGRVGIGSFGIFLHLGGANTIPFTYVENCAEAIVLAGIVEIAGNQSFNVVDDELPSSRRFLRLYKKNVRWFPSMYFPHALSYMLCYMWEKYSSWSYGQLPNSFNRMEWHAIWKKTIYSNYKIKKSTGWKPRVPTSEGLQNYFTSCREKHRHA